LNSSTAGHTLGLAICVPQADLEKDIVGNRPMTRLAVVGVDDAVGHTESESSSGTLKTGVAEIQRSTGHVGGGHQWRGLDLN